MKRKSNRGSKGKYKKYGEDITKDICKYIRGGNTARDACLLCDICEDTYYNWIKIHPDFAEAIKKAEQECKNRHIQTLQLVARGEFEEKLNKTTGKMEVVWKYRPNWYASAWWLERKYKDEFGQRVDMTTDGKAINAPVVSAEKLREIKKIIKKNNLKI